MHISICIMTVSQNICRYPEQSKVFTEVKIKTGLLVYGPV